VRTDMINKIILNAYEIIKTKYIEYNVMIFVPFYPCICNPKARIQGLGQVLYVFI
jgi:hypothetical protein